MRMGIGVFEMLLLAFVALSVVGIAAIVRAGGRAGDRETLDELDRPAARERNGPG